MDIYQGDPRLVMTERGSTLIFKGGQPVMDQGIENQALISLFTTPGWIGNSLLADQNQHIGSDFLESTRQPITLNMLTEVEQAAIRALQSPIFGNITVNVSNPRSDVLKIVIRLEPPGQDARTLILTRNGQNWQNQAVNPANERI